VFQCIFGVISLDSILIKPPKEKSKKGGDKTEEQTEPATLATLIPVSENFTLKPYGAGYLL
jgi:hypothetical protein